MLLYANVIICKCYKVYEDYIEFDTRKAEDTKKVQKDKILVFQKNSIKMQNCANPRVMREVQFRSSFNYNLRGVATTPTNI